MRCSAKAAVFLLSPAVVYSLTAPLPTRSAVDRESSASEDPPVLLWQNNQRAIVRFGALCPGCSAGIDDALPFELDTNIANEACGESGVSLNGKELVHTWDGNLGYGSGTIDALLSDGVIAAELSASWQSICIPAPPQSPNQHTAQVLTVRIDHIGEEDVEEGGVGFTASFTQVGSPEILRLCTHPVNISDDDASLEAWRDPSDSERLENQPNILGPGNDLEKQLEQELKSLQDLKAQADDLQHRISAKEQKIRKLLQQDCRSLFAKWQQCGSIGCIVKVSLQTVPEMIRQIRYRFGPLPSSVSEKIVPACNRHGDSFDPYTLYQRPSSASENPGNYTDFSRAAGNETKGPELSNVPVHTANQPKVPSPDLELSPHDRIRDFARSCAILLLIASLAALAVKVSRNSLTCRRRRVDLAARREERRARRAYRSAARRLRWRQWWEGRSYQSAPSVSSSHSLQQINDAERGQNADSDADQEPGQGAMQAEILGLRRVLEFVGELVRNNGGDVEGAPRSRQHLRHEIVELPAGISSAGNTAPSSTVGLTTVGSPRSSSLVSLDTASSVTLETLDTLDTDPPSYYR
ncbi:hypothetical protein VTN02DRAFT_3994 [Thermoascus thermophilus]